MTTVHKFAWLMGGIGTVLVLASTIGWILDRRVTSAGGRDTVDNLNARIKAWWGMIAVFAIAFWIGPVATVVLFAFTSFLSLREFISLTPTRRGDHWPLFLCFFVLIPVQYVLIGADWYGLYTIFIPVYAFLLLPAVAALAGDTEDFLTRQAKVQWAVMICIYAISHAPALMLLRLGPDHTLDRGQNALLVFYLLLVVQSSDVLQYVFGKLFGKHKVAPLVSPSKTWEGLIGGGLSATALGAAMWWITPFPPLAAAGFSLVIVVMGFLGGLTLSAVKRSLGAKDWGMAIEGHGGMMDRMDSVSFSAPIFFHLVRWFFG